MRPAIRELQETSPSLDGDLLQALDKLENITGLKKLSISHTEKLSRPAWIKLGSLKSLEELTIISCKKVTRDYLSFLQPMTRLRSLSLHKCPKVWPCLLHTCRRLRHG